MPATIKPALPPSRRIPEAEVFRGDAEMRWLSEHRKEYLGEWVALDGGRLISHGKDADAVFAAARAQMTVPFLHYFHPDADDGVPTVGGF